MINITTNLICLIPTTPPSRIKFSMQKHWHTNTVGRTSVSGSLSPKTFLTRILDIIDSIEDHNIKVKKWIPHAASCTTADFMIEIYH